MVHKHPTASVYIYAHSGERWYLCLLFHKRLQKWMVPGGHVEADETAAEAGVREVLEETGLLVDLAENDPLGLGLVYPHHRDPAPWSVASIPVPPDDHEPSSHVHVDHVFSAQLSDLVGSTDGEYEFEWQPMQTLDEVDMFQDSRMLAEALLDKISTGGGASRPSNPSRHSPA